MRGLVDAPGAARYETAPASVAQQQLFFIQQLLDGAPTYHVPLFFALRGPVEEDALRRAIQRVGERHEALRTHFAVDEAGLRQVVDTRWRLDWQSGSHRDDAELAAWMSAQAALAYDLERPALFRAGLMRRDDGTATLMLAMHHAICDGWSVTVLMEDLISCYRNEVAGIEPDLPEPEFQYADYAAWQQEWLASPEAARQLDFWSATLHGELPVVALPADRSGPADDASTTGGSLRFALPADAVDELRGLAQSANTTVGTALLAVFALLIGSYTGLDDVIVGTPMANRSRAEFERTVGLFVNLVPIRTDLAGGPTFRALLDRVRGASLRAHDNHEVPFETIVQHVGSPRVAEHDPIVQVLFMTVGAIEQVMSVGDLEITPIEYDTGTAKFEVSLEIHDDQAQPAAVLEYRADRFSPAWAERFAAHYRRAVTAVAAYPDTSVGDIFSVPPAQRAQRQAKLARPPLVDDDDTPYVAPRDETERALAQIWAQTLQREEIGIDDNYFEVGGDSIRSIQILARAREQGLAIRLTDLMTNQTIRELAPFVGTADREPVPPPEEPFALIDPKDRARIPDGVLDAYPLTSLQAGMLYHSELTAAHQIYHNVASYHIRAPYGEAAWRSAVAALLTRHEMLRTAFAVHGFSEGIQLVHDEVRAPITFEDLRSVEPKAQQAELTRRFHWERAHPFDWERAPLIRFHVQRRTEDTVTLWIVEHHAIMDGWSARSLFGELLTRYVERLDGGHDVPPAPAARFRSLVRLERAAVESADQRRFWTEQLDAAPVTVVPHSTTDPRPPDMAIAGRDLPAEVSAEMLRLATAWNVPVRILLLALHLRVLALLGGDGDVVTGVVYNGRVEETDGDRVIGLFLNTLPFRQRLDGGSWADLVREVADTDLAIQPNRRFPMSEIQRLLGGTPLFETYFNYTHFHVEEQRPGETVTVLAEDGEVPTSFPFGAEFSRDVTTGAIGLGLRYDATRYTGTDIDRIHGYYLAAARAMVAGPDSAHRAAVMLSEPELALLAAWNDTAKDFPEEHVLHRLVEQQVRRTPDLPAVVFEGSTLTYRELDARANRLAHRLVDRGVRRGQFVAVCLDRSPELVISLLAVLKAGAAYLPIDPDNPAARIDTMLADASAALVLTSPVLSERLRTSATPTEIVTAAPEPADAEPPRVDVRPEDPAYLMFTSGSTGRPKGVVISNRAICNRLLWMQDEFGLDAEDAVLQKTPFSFDVSVWEFFWPLLRGARLVLARPDGHRDPEYLTGLIREQAVTTIHFVPSMLRAFLDNDRSARHPSLRLVVCSGEALGYELQQRFLAQCEAELVNLYGPTEAAVDVTCWHCRPDERGMVPIGRPISNLRTHVLDTALTPVPVGVTGELYLGGVGLSDGYHGQPELTAQRFVRRRVPTGGTERLYRTGDLARWLPGGELEYLGRIDQQVKVRGFRVELGEIEAVLAGHESVHECAVALRADGLIGYVVPVGDAELDTPRLRSYLATRLPDYMIPSRWLRLDQLPLSHNGKLDRRRLPDERLAVPSSATRPTQSPPVTDAQRRLAGLWEDVLGVRPIGIHDSFFDLGGHSLLALRLVMLIRKEFGRKVPVADLLTNNTVAKLAEVLERLTKAPGDAARMLPIRLAGEAPPLSLIHPVGGGVFCYLPLAAELTRQHPVYGVISEGLVSGTVLNVTVEDIAASYLKLLMDKQPSGPYYVGGWSFGAVLAFEVACQLLRRGEEVALLCMIDAAYPGQFEDSLRDEDVALLLFVDVLRAAGMAVPEDVDSTWAQALAGFDTLEDKLRWLVGRLPSAGEGLGAELEQWAAYFKVFGTNLMAHNSYQPQRYPGEVTYIEGLDGGSIDSAEMWAKSVGGTLRVHTVEAHHYDLLRPPHVRETARIINAALGGA